MFVYVFLPGDPCFVSILHCIFDQVLKGLQMVNGVVGMYALNTALCMRCHAFPLQNVQESNAVTTKEAASMNHSNMTANNMQIFFLMKLIL